MLLKIVTIMSITFLRVPHVGEDQDLRYKVSSAGITILNMKLKTRYVGSRSWKVDINGKLWTNLKGFKEAVNAGIDKKEKPGKWKQTGVVNSNHSVNANIENLPTGQSELLTNNSELSTKKSVRTYKLKKSLVRQRLLSWVRTAKGKKEMFFWTITFPPCISDDIAYRAYNTWLTQLRKKKMLRTYLWIAERQKNSTIHFHIAIPHKMSAKEANKWMQITLRGLVDKGEINWTVAQAKRYNGVDIAKNRDTRKATNFARSSGTKPLARYLTKYVTKNDTEFTHYCWHCSRDFSALCLGCMMAYTELLRYKLALFADEDRARFGDYFCFVPWKKEAFTDTGPRTAVQLFIKHIDDLNSHVQKIIDNGKN